MVEGKLNECNGKADAWTDGLTIHASYKMFYLVKTYVSTMCISGRMRMRPQKGKRRGQRIPEKNTRGSEETASQAFPFFFHLSYMD